MADKTPEPAAQPVAPIPRTTRPLSEALLNEKWDRCLSSMLIRSGLGVSFGIVFSVLLFKRRAWPAWVGLGFGAGRAWEECDSSFKRTAAPPKDGLRVIRP
ncbi:Mitochondrial inner membrane organizing system component [Didymosphaeria variabile]|uniref:MICOS complex subunit MIC10 n=1 Tax=Didymosphaeria variabile TaxID=1932322 RepID=A0A9W9CCE5_9PLEO|nr:Mitochondrial inner membrane organizing system component [Didymosphaeria variabile]KAJ4355600.1 Mitochondrial inner membrane organizing system component [Didymosphaeria variabile]